MKVKIFNSDEVVIYDRVCRNAEFKSNPNTRSYLMMTDTSLDKPDTYVFLRDTDLVVFENCSE